MAAPSPAWLAVAGALLLAVAGAEAAMRWSSTSALHVGVVPPPVQLEPGHGANKTRYFAPPLTVSANGTSVAGAFAGKAASDARVKDVLHVVSRGGAPAQVTLHGARVDHSGVERFEWLVMDGAAVVAILDARASQPSATFTLLPGARLDIDLRVDLAEGSGIHNSPSSVTLGVDLS